VAFFYPVFRSRRVHSALVPGGRPYDDKADKITGTVSA